MNERNKSFSLGIFYQKYGIVLLLAAEIILFAALLGPGTFLNGENILSVGRQISYLGIVSIGMTMTMLTGGLDISVGAMYALTGVIGAIIFENLGVPLPLVILVSLLVGALFGTINGIVVALFRVPALITTLGMQTILKGIGYVFTKGIPVKISSDTFKAMGQGYVFSFIPITLVIMAAMFVLGWWFLNKTYIGRRIYAVGGNEEAARLAGINATRLIASTYTICGALAGFTGVLMAARLGSGQPASGADFPMDVLTAVVLGGVSVAGGKGSIINVLFGALIMGFLINGMYMMGLSENWQWITKGVVLIMVVALSNLGMVRKKKAKSK